MQEVNVVPSSRSTVRIMLPSGFPTTDEDIIIWKENARTSATRKLLRDLPEPLRGLVEAIILHKETGRIIISGRLLTLVGRLGVNWDALLYSVALHTSTAPPVRLRFGLGLDASQLPEDAADMFESVFKHINARLA